MLLELRHAWRGLRRSPGFAASAIVTLALAIGASTAMFGMLDAVLLRPLPFPSPDRLAMVWIEVPTQDLREGRSAFATVEAWRRQSRSFTDVAVLDPVSVALTHAGELEQVSGARVSPNLFGLLGVVPDRGRLFTDKDAEERQRLALLSHRFWRARFGGSDAVVGTTVLIDGQPSRIIGVLPDTVAQAGFTADVWEPHTLFADWDTRRAASGAGSWFVIGRLRAGAAIEPAQRELEAILARTDPPPAGAAGTRGIRIVTLGEQVTGPRSRAVVWLLTGAALLVWLVAAVNVAGLTLARGVARLPQLAIRVALGASRARLARSLLVESLTLAGSAGIIGLAVALAAVRAIRVFGP
ncbi:MAG: ABC transporter permease, partial [Vicinamibacteria bacterium]